MLVESLRNRVASRVMRLLNTLEPIPLGRRFDGRRGRLGVMQRWYASQPTQRVVVAVLELPAPATLAAVEQAVRQLCARQPFALGVCEARSPRSVRLRSLTEADVVPLTTAVDEALWPVAEALTHRAFELGAPLFRLVRSSDGRQVACAFDHLIADGVAASRFACELARMLTSMTPSAAFEDVALPLDARLDLRPSIAGLIHAFRAGSPSLLLVPSDAGQSAQLNTRIRAQRFDRAVVDALLGQARCQGVTLHAVLSAAALLSAHAVLGARRSTLRLHTPISLRDQCQPPPTGMGVFIAGIDTDCDVIGDEDAWSLAHRCMRDLRRQRPAVHRKLGLLALAGDHTALAQKYERTAHGRTATVEVSNVGRMSALPEGAAVWLTQGVHYHSALFVLTIATSDSDGVLRCCLSFPEPLITAVRADQFMQTFQRQLQHMAATSGH